MTLRHTGYGIVCVVIHERLALLASIANTSQRLIRAVVITMKQSPS